MAGSRPAPRTSRPTSHGCRNSTNDPAWRPIGKLTRSREIARKATSESAYYLLSTALSAEHFGNRRVRCGCRSSWGLFGPPSDPAFQKRALLSVLRPNERKTRRGSDAHQ
jgi:hypothetical protein